MTRSESVFPLRPELEQRKRLVEVERSAQRLQVEAELNDRHGDVRLDADDHRARAAQLRRQGNRAQCAGDKGVDDV